MNTAKTAFVLSIILLCISFFPLLGSVAILSGIFGVVLGIVAIIEASKNGRPQKKAIIGTGLCALSIIVGGINLSWSFPEFMKGFGEDFDRSIKKSLHDGFNLGYNKGFKDGVEAGIEAGARRGVDITPNLNMRAIENGILNSNSQ